jgi:hypothetical protein
MTSLVSGNFQVIKWASRYYNRRQFKQQLTQVIYSLITPVLLLSAEKWISPCCVNSNMSGKTLIYDLGYMHKELNVVHMLCD